MNTFDYFEYIEKIILNKDRNPYEIFVIIPVEDLMMNKKRMKTLFDKMYEQMKMFREYIAGNYCEEYDNFRFKLFRYRNSYFIEYSYKDHNKRSSSTLKLSKFTEEDYINLIKKIGSYYEWEDDDGKLTENIKKKQLNLFSLLFNHFKTI
jgi:hypothetical protein